MPGRSTLSLRRLLQVLFSRVILLLKVTMLDAATCVSLSYVAYSIVYKINSVVFSVTAGTEITMATNDMAISINVSINVLQVE